MVKEGFVWECECGHIDYGQYPPQECSSCDMLDSFLKVPEDEVEEREAEKVLSLKPGDDEDSEEDI